MAAKKPRGMKKVTLPRDAEKWQFCTQVQLPDGARKQVHRRFDKCLASCHPAVRATARDAVDLGSAPAGQGPAASETVTWRIRVLRPVRTVSGTQPRVRPLVKMKNCTKTDQPRERPGRQAR